MTTDEILESILEHYALVLSPYVHPDKGVIIAVECFDSNGDVSFFTEVCSVDEAIQELKAHLEHMAVN